MEWPAVRQLLQGVVPQSYWTALENHDDGAWTAFTPGLPVDGGMTIAGSRSAAYSEAQRRIAVTIRNMYEVGQRVPPMASAMSLSAAQAWDSSHREVFEQLDEDVRGGAGNTSQAPKIVERQWRQVHVDLSLADDSPMAAHRAELRDALRQRGVRSIWASDPESAVDDEEEEGDEDVDGDEEDDDDMMLDLAQGDHGLGIVASDEPPEQPVPQPRQTGVRRGRPVESADNEQQEDMSEDEEWGPSRLGYAARESRVQAITHRAEQAALQSELAHWGERVGRAVRPRTESRLETLAGMLSSESGLGEAETRARILDLTGALRDSTGALRDPSGVGIPLGPGGQGNEVAAAAPDEAAAQQPSLRALEHRDQEEMALPEAVRLAHLQSAEEDRMERMLMLRRDEAARTTRRHSERQRSFTRLYQAARAGARPRGVRGEPTWKEGEAALC